MEIIPGPDACDGLVSSPNGDLYLSLYYPYNWFVMYFSSQMTIDRPGRMYHWCNGIGYMNFSDDYGNTWHALLQYSSG